MDNLKHIVSFSGGKDSTAMLLMMLEKNMPIDDIVFADTGVEFPQMYEHIKKVEKYIGRGITIIRGKHSFEYLLSDIERPYKSKYTHNGRGWADMKIRWCTSELKTYPIEKYLRDKKPYIQYIGIAFDEKHRAEKYKNCTNKKYPLIDWGISEKDALQYCYDCGFDWGGLYQKFKRVSCYLCPLQPLRELKILYNDYPELWKEMLRLDKKSYRDFRSDYTLSELDKKFYEMSLQKELF